VAQKSPRKFDDLVKGLPTYKVTSKPATTPAERDDEKKIYGVRGLDDLTREVIGRALPKKTSTPS